MDVGMGTEKDRSLKEDCDNNKICEELKEMKRDGEEENISKEKIR
jgi:hypothetical protein